MSGTHAALRLMEGVSALLFDAIEGTRPGSLALYRAAWAPSDRPLHLATIASLVRGLPDTIETDLSSMPPAAVFPPARGRVLLNLLLLAADSLHGSGQIVVAGTPGDLFIHIAGPNAGWPPGTALCLIDESEALAALGNGRNLQMAFTATLAHAVGIRLSSLLSPSGANEPAILHFC